MKYDLRCVEESLFPLGFFASPFLPSCSLLPCLVVVVALVVVAALVVPFLALGSSHVGIPHRRLLALYS